MNIAQIFKQITTEGFKSGLKSANRIVKAQIVNEVSDNSIKNNSIESIKENYSLTDNDDDLLANFMSSAFGIIEERRKMAELINDYKERLAHSKSIFADVLKEKSDLEKSLEDRTNQLLSLQSQVEEQQKKYENLMKDHKSFRVNELNARKKLQEQIKEYQADYETLKNEFRQYQEDKETETMDNKEKIRNEVEKYNHLQLKYNTLFEENRILLERVASFAKQVSSLSILETLSLNCEKFGLNDKPN